MNTIEQFKDQQYINLETFRKNGAGVKTPVWFAQDGNTLRVWTQADAGKTKRIRREGKVRIVSSTASGEPTGEWMEVRATVLDAPNEITHTKNLFRKKYGMMFNIISFFGKVRRSSYITIKIEF